MNNVHVLDFSAWNPVSGVAPADVTVAGTAVALGELNAKTQKVLVGVDADVRFTLDGTDPVGGSHGVLLTGGGVLYLGAYQAGLLKMIRDGATSANAHVIECTV
jgi:hypothetical protein